MRLQPQSVLNRVRRHKFDFARHDVAPHGCDIVCILGYKIQLKTVIGIKIKNFNVILSGVNNRKIEELSGSCRHGFGRIDWIVHAFALPG